MKNRDSAHPGRIKLTPVDAANGIYDLTRADEPRDEGTPLNKKLLDYAVAACGATAGTATAYTLDDEFGGFTLTDGAKVNFRLHVASGANPTLNVNGTGPKKLINMFGTESLPGTPAGEWITARYSREMDGFVVEHGGAACMLYNMEVKSASAIDIPIPDHVRVCKIYAPQLTQSVHTNMTMTLIGATAVKGTETSLSFDDDYVSRDARTISTAAILHNIALGDARLDATLCIDGTSIAFDAELDALSNAPTSRRISTKARGTGTVPTSGRVVRLGFSSAISKAKIIVEGAL